MHEAIKTWLDQDGPYQAGLTLLEQAGVRGIMLRTLSLGEDAYNRGLLTQQLQQILAKPVQAGPKNVLPEVTMVSCTAVKNADDYSAPVRVAMDFGASDSVLVITTDSAEYLRDQVNDLDNERTELKARLRFAQAPDRDADRHQADRRDWAFRIVDITDTIDDIMSRLDFQAQYGYMPPKEEPAADVDDVALLNNVRTYVSKYAAKLKKRNLTPEQRQSAQRLLDKYTSEKNRLELKLSKPHDSHPTG